MQRIAFDGKVVFEVTGKNIRESVVGSALMRAVPEFTAFDETASRIFLNLIYILSRTKSVITDTEETDPNIIALAAFWTFTQGNADYRAIWEKFLDLPDMDIVVQWSNVIKLGQDAQLLAPTEVQPGTPTNDQLEKMGEGGADFLAKGGNT